MYAPARFLLDFLRATDVARPDRRYLALTPAQWACLATAALGVYLWRRPAPPSPPPDPEPAAPRD
jgi:phosphatidylglycerol:prolipoprotein diacylglycerol transferase